MSLFGFRLETLQRVTLSVTAQCWYGRGGNICIWKTQSLHRRLTPRRKICSVSLGLPLVAVLHIYLLLETLFHWERKANSELGIQWQTNVSRQRESERTYMRENPNEACPIIDHPPLTACSPHYLFICRYLMPATIRSKLKLIAVLSAGQVRVSPAAGTNDACRRLICALLSFVSFAFRPFHFKLLRHTHSLVIYTVLEIP